MWRFDKLRQYRFIQNGVRQYTLRVDGARCVYTEEELPSFLKSVLGKEEKIAIEHVEGLPHLASGKFKKTVGNDSYDPKGYQ